MIRLESRVIHFVQRHGLILPHETLVVGVSGGADSVCLLHLLARWQRELNIKLHIAHFNHQLRGTESEEDAKYVANLANRLAIPSTTDKQDVAAYKAERNCSLEEAARELRYNFLARVAHDVGASRVAIAHTRDDRVETVLMHILRGAGTSGLRGLEPCSAFPLPYSGPVASYHSEPVTSCHSEPKAKNLGLLVIRPLLDIAREETLSYCQNHHLEPRIDSSNLSLSFLRNRLRLELLPSLREYNPSIDQALLRLSKIAGDDNSFMEQQALQLWDKIARQEGDAIYLDKRKTVTLPIALQRQVIRLAITRILRNTRDIEVDHIEAVRSLLSKPVGKSFPLPHSLVCQGGYNEVVIASQSSLPSSPCPFPPLQGKFPLKVPGEILLPGWRVIASISSTVADQSLESSKASSPSIIASEAKQSQGSFLAQFDLEQVGTDLFIRQRQSGDRFQPLGMSIPKKLQDFMVDAKIPLSWRDRIPIVCSSKQILWVMGWRIDDRVKVTEATKGTLLLEFIKSSSS